ncbi:hypothetical protein BV22DRAFT_909052 [Leucogyrophana mollusca]|uniref:Uncharacterized protein n=1 Tax=Leucogyrophana mollusca TaxID=85980 RepID=A0ACB8B0S8_9AGAM|nr:hypothetical protein BV22DRAFT_909052 [Leucogyrophana mollusca]
MSLTGFVTRPSHPAWLRFVAPTGFASRPSPGFASLRVPSPRLCFMSLARALLHGPSPRCGSAPIPGLYCTTLATALLPRPSQLCSKSPPWCGNQSFPSVASPIQAICWCPSALFQVLISGVTTRPFPRRGLAPHTQRGCTTLALTLLRVPHPRRGYTSLRPHPRLRSRLPRRLYFAPPPRRRRCNTHLRPQHRSFQVLRR